MLTMAMSISKVVAIILPHIAIIGRSSLEGITHFMVVEIILTIDGSGFTSSVSNSSDSCSDEFHLRRYVLRLLSLKIGRLYSGKLTAFITTNF